MSSAEVRLSRSSPKHIGSVDPYALKIPAPKGRNTSLQWNVTSPFHAEPGQSGVPRYERRDRNRQCESLRLDRSRDFQIAISNDRIPELVLRHLRILAFTHAKQRIEDLLSVERGFSENSIQFSRKLRVEWLGALVECARSSCCDTSLLRGCGESFVFGENGVRGFNRLAAFPRTSYLEVVKRQA